MIIIRASHKVVGRIKRNEVWWESKVSWTSITKHCKTSGTALRSTKLQVTRVLLNTFFSSTVYTLCKKTQKQKKTVFFFSPRFREATAFSERPKCPRGTQRKSSPRHPLRLWVHHLLGPNLLLYIPVQVFWPSFPLLLRKASHRTRKLICSEDNKSPHYLGLEC